MSAIPLRWKQMKDTKNYIKLQNSDEMQFQKCTVAIYECSYSEQSKEKASFVKPASYRDAHFNGGEKQKANKLLFDCAI